jgi:hypothetical protein
MSLASVGTMRLGCREKGGPPCSRARDLEHISAAQKPSLLRLLRARPPRKLIVQQ